MSHTPVLLFPNTSFIERGIFIKSLIEKESFFNYPISHQSSLIAQALFGLLESYWLEKGSVKKFFIEFNLDFSYTLQLDNVSLDNNLSSKMLKDSFLTHKMIEHIDWILNLPLAIILSLKEYLDTSITPENIEYQIKNCLGEDSYFKRKALKEKIILNDVFPSNDNATEVKQRI